MIKLLTPLGLLGLLSILILILIYLIKPNYQQKRVSSTFIWKLSLRYRKKRIPINKFRNILLIICQIVILTACAVILAQPNKVLAVESDQSEIIAIIDSSASMRSTFEEKTRFERAVDQLMQDFDTMPQDGVMSVIIASESPYYLRENVAIEQRALLQEDLNQLIVGNQCSYGVANISRAIELCEKILKANPIATINLYTDVTYSYIPKNINVKLIDNSAEWNAAILDAEAELQNDGYYQFTVETACYGRDAQLLLTMSVQGANASDASDDDYGENFDIEALVTCTNNTPNTVIFTNNIDSIQEEIVDDENITYVDIYAFKTYSYKNIHFSLELADDKDFDVGDSFPEDNVFDLYGGLKPVLKVQYASTKPNPFVNAALDNVKKLYQSIWDIQIRELRYPDESYDVQNYDFYIFEHFLPETMPTDGVVFFMDPDGDAPVGAGFRVGDHRDFQKGQVGYFATEVSHEILRAVNVGAIFCTQYVRFSNIENFETLMTVDTYPVFMVKNEPDAKVAILGISVHYSNISQLPSFPIMFRNMFDYFLPPTVVGNSFEVNETISLNARGEQLDVFRGDGTLARSFNEFPAKFSTPTPGTYTLSQTTFGGKAVSEQIYVKIPRDESNIKKEEAGIPEPYQQVDDRDYFDDLLIYVAAALVAVLFIEWILHTRDELI